MVKYKRVLLKLSGEMLAGDRGYGISRDAMAILSKEIQELYRLNVEVALVVGGGNIFRGTDAKRIGLDQIAGDYMGMLGTLVNALALQNYFEKDGLTTRVMSAISMQEIAEPYIRRRAIRHLEKGRVVIFAAGTGSPHFTTDTAAALRAAEIKAEVLLKATKVEGIYDKDPKLENDAVMYKHVTYKTFLEKDLRVMDATAVALCREYGIPVIVFNLLHYGNIVDVVKGKDIGTLVCKE